jgi:L-alanine-DL-glutamate epimerase-like enolase superfamily enzyme
VDYRAGTATITTAEDSVTVTFSGALPSTNYAVELTTDGDTSGWGHGGTTFYLNAESKSTTGFTIAFRNTNAGTLTDPGTNITVDWEAIANS